MKLNRAILELFFVHFLITWLTVRRNIKKLKHLILNEKEGEFSSNNWAMIIVFAYQSYSFIIYSKSCNIFSY